MFLQSQGGNINVAKLVTRLESNTGPVLIDWLKSIPKYPKAFKIKMRPINELLNFNVRNLFIGEFSNEVCKKTLMRRCIHGTSIEDFQNMFDRRRKSLEFAIEIFRHRVSFALFRTTNIFETVKIDRYRQGQTEYVIVPDIFASLRF